MFNTITVCGRVAADIEVAGSKSGISYGKFRIGFSKGKKDASGNWVNDTTWFNVTLFGAAATNLQNKLTKGAIAIVSGQLEPEKWTTAEGVEKLLLKIIARDVKVVQAGAPQEEKVDSDDIPF